MFVKQYKDREGNPVPLRRRIAEKCRTVYKVTMDGRFFDLPYADPVKLRGGPYNFVLDEVHALVFRHQGTVRAIKVSEIPESLMCFSEESWSASLSCIIFDGRGLPWHDVPNDVLHAPGEAIRQEAAAAAAAAKAAYHEAEGAPLEVSDELREALAALYEREANEIAMQCQGVPLASLPEEQQEVCREMLTRKSTEHWFRLLSGELTGQLAAECAAVIARLEHIEATKTHHEEARRRCEALDREAGMGFNERLMAWLETQVAQA